MIVEVEIDYEKADKIVIESLRDLLGILENDLELREAGTGMAIFKVDKDKDIEILKKHIKAFKIVIKYYAGDL